MSNNIGFGKLRQKKDLSWAVEYYKFYPGFRAHEADEMEMPIQPESLPEYAYAGKEVKFEVEDLATGQIAKILSPKPENWTDIKNEYRSWIATSKNYLEFQEWLEREFDTPVRK